MSRASVFLNHEEETAERQKHLRLLLTSLLKDGNFYVFIIYEVAHLTELVSSLRSTNKESPSIG